MPGDPIVQQGCDSDSMFIILCGRAAVLKGANGFDPPEPDATKDSGSTRQRIGVLCAGSIGGELSMLGVTQRLARVEAETFCMWWEVSSHDAVPIIKKHPGLSKNLLKMLVHHAGVNGPQAIGSLPLFSRVQANLCIRFAIHAEQTAFFPATVVFAEGQACDTLHILHMGQCSLEKCGINFRIVEGGAHFNSMNMLGLHKVCFATLTTRKASHMLAISRTAYSQILDSMSAAGCNCNQDKKTIHGQAHEDFDALKQTFEKYCVRSQRCQALRRKQQSHWHESLPVILADIWAHWKTYASNCARKRQERLQRSAQIDEWSHKSTLARATRDQRIHKETTIEQRAAYRKDDGPTAFKLATPLIPANVAATLEKLERPPEGCSTEASPRSCTASSPVRARLGPATHRMSEPAVASLPRRSGQPCLPPIALDPEEKERRGKVRTSVYLPDTSPSSLGSPAAAPSPRRRRSMGSKTPRA